MDKSVSFLKTSFKYIAISALGLFVIVGLFGFLTHQYDEYMARVDEKTMFKCSLPDADKIGWFIILETSPRSRSKAWYYEGVKVLDNATVPNSEEAYLFWDKDYSAARTPYEIYIVNNLYQALKLMDDPNDPEVQKFITINRTTLIAKRYRSYTGDAYDELQCELYSDEKRVEIEKKVYESKQKTLTNRQI